MQSGAACRHAGTASLAAAVVVFVVVVFVALVVATALESMAVGPRLRRRPRAWLPRGIRCRRPAADARVLLLLLLLLRFGLGWEDQAAEAEQDGL